MGTVKRERKDRAAERGEDETSDCGKFRGEQRPRVGIPSTRRHQCFTTNALKPAFSRPFFAASALFWSLNGPTCTRKYLSLCGGCTYAEKCFFCRLPARACASSCLARAATCKTIVPLGTSGGFAALRSTGVRDATTAGGAEFLAFNCLDCGGVGDVLWTGSQCVATFADLYLS